MTRASQGSKREQYAQSASEWEALWPAPIRKPPWSSLTRFRIWCARRASAISSYAASESARLCPKRVEAARMAGCSRCPPVCGRCAGKSPCSNINSNSQEREAAAKSARGARRKRRHSRARAKPPQRRNLSLSNIAQQSRPRNRQGTPSKNPCNAFAPRATRLPRLLPPETMQRRRTKRPPQHPHHPESLSRRGAGADASRGVMADWRDSPSVWLVVLSNLVCISAN